MTLAMAKENSTMNTELWGKLQHHIGLENVYAKLPFREFFQLRLVCKDWDRLASDRAFLEDNFKDPIPKPYFVLKAQGMDSKLHGLLTCDVSSGLWSWTRLCLKNQDGVFACEGLIYGYNNLRRSEHRVFNVHTKVWHTLPQGSELDEMLAYDLEKDVWSTLDPPLGDSDDYLRAIGAWQGRLYDLTEIVGVSVSVWQLDEQYKQDWREVDRMPDDLYSWLRVVEDFDLDVDYDDLQILTSFCNEYVLVYAWLPEFSRAKRFVLCNLATKAWKKVDLPVPEICIPEET